MFQAAAPASAVEEAVFDCFTQLAFTRLDRKRGGAQLFTTTLEKALFSSPAACVQTIENRLKRLEKEGNYHADMRQLAELRQHVLRVTPEQFSRYQKCLEVIRSHFQWDGRDAADRLVIFTERIETMRFLKEHLPRDLYLKPEQTAVLHGGMSDKEQQEIVEEFGKEQSPVRLLIASDVASEGINLHYLSHRMIHFDIPWALMVFQQRNGRIDRYGQKFNPEIVYLLTQSQNAKIKGDLRILELLIQKDNQAVENIGDPSSLMGVFDIDKQEEITAHAIETGQTVAEFEHSMQAAAFDPLAYLLGEIPPENASGRDSTPRSMPSVFPSDYDYTAAALDYLRSMQPIQARFYPDEHRIDLTAPDELAQRFKHLPREMYPPNGQFILIEAVEKMKEEFERCRKYENAWPQQHYLWEQHPVVQWINDKVTASFRRQQAPVLILPEVVLRDEMIFLLSGLIPNRKGHPLIHQWFGVVFQQQQFKEIQPLEQVLDRTQLGRKAYPNPQTPVNTDILRRLLNEAVTRARDYMSVRRQEFETTNHPQTTRPIKGPGTAPRPAAPAAQRQIRRHHRIRRRPTAQRTRTTPDRRPVPGIRTLDQRHHENPESPLHPGDRCFTIKDNMNKPQRHNYEKPQRHKDHKEKLLKKSPLCPLWLCGKKNMLTTNHKGTKSTKKSS